MMLKQYVEALKFNYPTHNGMKKIIKRESAFACGLTKASSAIYGHQSKTGFQPAKSDSPQNLYPTIARVSQ